MRILVLNYEYPPLGGGAAPVTAGLAGQIAEKGHIIDIVTMGFRGLPKKEESGNLTVYRVWSLRAKKEKSSFIEMLSFIPSALAKADALMKKNRYDIIHAHFIIPTGLIAMKLSRKHNIPYIITSHGSDVPGYNPDRFRALHKLFIGKWRQIVDGASYIVTPSYSLKKLILKSADKKDIRVIQNGILLKNKNPKKEKIILYAGRLFPRKGVQHLIEASSAVPDGWEIIIAGDGDYRKTLEGLAGNSNKIKFTGWLAKDELESLYEKSSIFVLPSSEESFGMVLAEAMVNRDAIITTRGTACEEIVSDSGLLIDKGDVGGLKKNLRMLIDDKRLLKEYQERSFEKSREYGWDHISKKYIELYINTIKG